MLSQFPSIFNDVNLNKSVNVFESCCGGGGYFIPFKSSPPPGTWPTYIQLTKYLKMATTGSGGVCIEFEGEYDIDFVGGGLTPWRGFSLVCA